MIDLNDKSAISAIDKKNTYGSIAGLAKQCKQAWEEIQAIPFPNEYKNAKNIVLCGMGGSAYAAYFVKALFNDMLQIPFELVNGYTLPKYVGKDTLVLLSSYSGSTEEPLACAGKALKMGARITAIANGSKLEEFTKANNLPAYIFTPKYNPSGQPRLGGGYMIFGHIFLLAKLGLITLSENDAMSAISYLQDKTLDIEIEAKRIAPQIMEKIPVIVAAEHLSGNAHALRNQLNETGKNFSAYSIIPELNHHLMEGLVFPKERILTFLLLQSSLYSPVIQKRFALTHDVIEKNNIQTINILIQGKTKLAQSMFTLSLGAYITFYLGILYNQDPSLIPWVDYFKNQLNKK